ncbi:carboxylesterase family protein [Actinoallomurus bryophytorum]|uniref:Carboxylic ester hydrolase n=1 Tax=Actinoallomurus bryophytorum TaxID=1490222 RepID=A0A543CD13_9ACTN|nr:carboxylesterase family protein [Actinoallomurus bryophytorum]TQL94989.1 para-nitrobenzyl esterase [Actinoallomurus bryophytorum]
MSAQNDTPEQPATRRAFRGRASRRIVIATGIAGAVAAGMAAPATASRVHGREDAAVVKTTDGAVRGIVTTDYREFAGIPYAEPPVGERRWAPPQQKQAWAGTRDATRTKSACPQTAGFLGDPPSDNEDCLYLNVTTPRNGGGKKLPVMFWIHGGGFYSGSGSLYGAQRLAEKGNVIVVTLNYRLGVLGFLAHPSLDGSAGKSGDYGLQDQQTALRWVRDNAAAFGGDAGDVTLFGESAGGVSTCSQLVSPAAKGLFSRAIIQSGPCGDLAKTWPFADGNWGVRPRAVADKQGTELAAKLGCGDEGNDVSCLRGKSVAELMDASAGGQGFGPAAGEGGVLPVIPATALATGEFNRVPVINGTTRDEHRTFTAAIESFTGHSATAQDYRDDLDGFFGKEKAAKVRAEYLLRAYDSPSTALSAIWTDSSWTCTALDTDHLLSTRVPTYAYEFADENAPWAGDGTTPSFPTGAFHAAELQYLFDDEQFTGPLSAAQQRLSDQMIKYWANFARTGNPNGGGTPPWPRFGADRARSLTTAGNGQTDLAGEHRCGFWQSL